MGEMRNSYTLLVGKPEGRDHLRKMDVVGIIIFKADLRCRILINTVMRHGTFLDYLIDY
jgi:predicted transposase YbfD/YdcC